MNKSYVSDLDFLEENGWTVECELPLEIRHNETNSFAKGLAAQYVIEGLKKEINGTLFQTIQLTSESIEDNRGVPYVLAHTMEEVGELAKEVAIEYLNSGKTPDSDGIIGETVDAIICLVDLLYVHSPELEEEDIIKVANKKLAKWKNRKS